MISILKELFVFMIARKKFWLLPIIFFMIILGFLIVIGQGSVLSPFIYTLF